MVHQLDKDIVVFHHIAAVHPLGRIRLRVVHDVSLIELIQCLREAVYLGGCQRVRQHEVAIALPLLPLVLREFPGEHQLLPFADVSGTAGRALRDTPHHTAGQ